MGQIAPGSCQLMKIKTLPVYSKLAEDLPPELAGAPWPLSQHQVETYRALTGGEYDVIFNTAMTGDGKSLAGYLLTLLNGINYPMFAMYPTNELGRDQEKQFTQTQQQWHTHLAAKSLNSAELDTLMAADDFSQRGDALLNEIRNHEVLLTNPDIFHYIMSHFYRRPNDAADKIIGPLVQGFKQFTFDEFHIFETPQVISVINAMLFIREIGGGQNHRFLFLSATPSLEMQQFLAQSGLRYQIINPAELGWYAHGLTPFDSGQWRQILHGCDLHFANGQMEDWVDQHQDDILLPFFVQNRPYAKGAIIVNSIAAAKRLLRRLEPVFNVHGLTVADNTGLTSQAGRAESYQADLLIGTSTIDVGVDFNINFLLFESLNAGTFLQRLGRLGRHKDYERDGRFYPFEKFEAYALVPPWVNETLFQGKDGAEPLLQTGTDVTRQQLIAAIDQAFPPPASFTGYVSDWGRFQSLNVMQNLYHPTIREQYLHSREQLGIRYEQTFNISLKKAHWDLKEFKKEGQELLLSEAMSFRGGSYFQIAILDETEPNRPHQPKLADLFMLLANGELAMLEEAEFYTTVEQAKMSRRFFETANGGKNGPLGYFRLLGWRNERTPYRLCLQHYLNGWDSNQFGQAIILKGVEIDAAGMNAVNQHLRRRHLPATLCLAYTHPVELKRMLYLPPLFQIFQFTSLDNVTGCVAFGREALLLHTKLKRRPGVNCGGGALIF